MTGLCSVCHMCTCVMLVSATVGCMMCFVTVVSFVIVVCLQLNSVVGQLHAVQSTSSYVALTVLTILGEHT